MIELNELRDKAYRNAVVHGWHEESLSNEHFLCLVMSELMEAVNADRKGKRALRKIFEANCNTPQLYPEQQQKMKYNELRPYKHGDKSY